MAPTVMQPVTLFAQGSGVQPVMTWAQVGAVPLQVPSAWQVCVALPLSM